MIQRLFSGTERPSKEDVATARPFFVILYMVMIMAYGIALVYDPSLRQPARLAIFTFLMLAHGGLHGLSLRLPTHKRWILPYFVLQGAFVFTIGLLTGIQGLTIGLYMALVGQAGGILWPNLRAVALAALFCLVVLTLNIIIMWGSTAFVESLPMVGSLFLFVLIYVTLFVRQAEARERAQKLLSELETAHQQLQEYADRVEELTISRERERMAQELHDTLAQGLAGLILQLEAADSHLESDNPVRAQAVVQQAMQRARTTLDEARRAIQALRPSALEEGNLTDAVGQAVDQFAATTGVHAAFEVEGGPLDVSPGMAQDVLRIVQECLTNVARHARASHVRVRLAGGSDGLQVAVQDDGVGFDLTKALGQPGCLGLLGMQERASRIGGALQVESTIGRGTKVILRTGDGKE